MLAENVTVDLALQPNSYAENLKITFKKAYAAIETNRDITMEKHKVHHDRKVRAANFSINDLVWVLDEQPNKSKFKKHWKPHPYRIIAKINDVTYKIKNTTKKSKKLIVNQCKLKKCFTTNAIDVDHQYNTTPEIKAEEQQFQATEHPRKRGRPRSKLKVQAPKPPVSILIW